MINLNKSYDTSNELLIQRWGNGIKLTRPNNKDRHFSALEKRSIGHVFSSPLNSYFLDTESVIQNINETTVKNCGFHSVKSAIGNTVEIAAKKQTAEFEFSHNREVIFTNQMILKEENYVRLDETNFSAINIKYPWYNEHNKIIGIFGLAFVIDSNQSLSENMNPLSALTGSLSFLIQTGLLGSANNTDYVSRIVPGEVINSVYLSKRYVEVLRLLVQGKTAKEIAKILNLSNRTIEYYLANIKNKMNVKSKSQLIEKIIDHFC